MYEPREVHAVSELLLNQVRLVRAITMLWARIADQSHLDDINHAVGIKNKDGIRIFSIVGDLGFSGDLYHVFELWLRVGLDLHLLRRRRKLVLIKGRMNN